VGEKFEREGGVCWGTYLKTQRTDQSAVDIQSHEVGVGNVIGWFNVSPEGIFGDQSGVEIGSIAELENSVPFDIAPGELARHALRKIRQLSGALN
jgi:hypothetical protein